MFLVRQYTYVFSWWILVSDDTTDPSWRLGLSDWVRLTLVVTLWPFGPKRAVILTEFMEPKERLGRKGSLGWLVVSMVWNLEVHSSNPSCYAIFWISSFFRRKQNQHCSTTGIVWYRKSGTESLYPLRPYPPFIQTLVGPTALFPRHFVFEP